MTYKEYEEKRNELRYKEKQLKEDILSSMNERYKEFIGKKVTLKGKRDVAYFGGFRKNCYDGIEPIFNKVKKDGSQSKTSCGWYVSSYNYDNIEMKIVNE